MKEIKISKLCVACGTCIKSCPTGALTINKGMYATVNHTECIVCGKCKKVCPASVISIVSTEDLE